jgi:hypothetical protein
MIDQLDQCFGDSGGYFLLDEILSIQIFDALLSQKGCDQFRNGLIGLADEFCLAEEFSKGNGITEQCFELVILGGILDRFSWNFQTYNIWDDNWIFFAEVGDDVEEEFQLGTAGLLSHLEFLDLLNNLQDDDLKNLLRVRCQGNEDIIDSALEVQGVS